nr:MAG TPA: hypothetical protein [Caudoviricetes sp.]
MRWHNSFCHKPKAGSFDLFPFLHLYHTPTHIF